MPSMSGCMGTVKYGASKEKWLGAAYWTYNEASQHGEYSDNTTDCAKFKIPGNPTGNGSIRTNLQITSGPPVAINDEVDLELHVDDTGQNYLAGLALVTALGISNEIENASEVPTYEVSYEAQGLFTRHGSLLPPA